MTSPTAVVAMPDGIFWTTGGGTPVYRLGAASP
jgi:hypothetical protein